ncbi:hypothetical protein [Catenuloplanes japonicus]|nr:hypothetical protein [Catenuloplanes japonicus]
MHDVPFLPESAVPVDGRRGPADTGHADDGAPAGRVDGTAAG